MFFYRDVKFYENVFPLTLEENIECEDDKMFSSCFPFCDTNMVEVYEDIIPDKASDSLISLEEESIKGLARGKFKILVGSDLHMPILDHALSYSNILDPTMSNSVVSSDPENDIVESDASCSTKPDFVLSRSSRVTKLPKHLKDYDVSINCTFMKFPIQQVYFLFNQFCCTWFTSSVYLFNE